MSLDDSGETMARDSSAWWRRWLAAPRAQDPLEQDRVSAFYRMLLSLLLIFLVVGPVAPMLSPRPREALIVELTSVVLLLAGIVAMRTRQALAGPLVMMIAWLAATAIIATQGIERGATGYAVVVVAAVLFWTPRRGVAVAALSTLALFISAELEFRGLIPGLGEIRSPMSVALDATVQLLVLLTLSAAGIYALRRAQARSARDSQRHRDFVARSPDGIFFMDAQGRIESFNPAAERLTGLPSHRVVGEYLWELDLVDERDEERARRALLATLGGEKLDGVFEVDLRVGADKTIPIEVHARRARRRGGGYGVMATCRDLRERRKGEAERAELEEMLNAARRMESVGRLAGGVAHDFNNLLTVMLTNTQLLLAEDPPGPHWRDDVEQIRDAAKRASDLTQQLLAFARRETLEPQVLNLNAPLEGLRDLLERLCGESITVDYQLAEDLPFVLIDQARLEQVLMNLAANARDAMPRGGRLVVRTARREVRGESTETLKGMSPGTYAWLRVEDTGEGMDDDTRAHIFEPFFSTKRERGGTGLGLATVYGIVGQSGGYVFVESVLGKGSAFDIYFPESITEATAENSAVEAWEPVTTHHDATILFVEDEAVVGRITQRVLTERGYEVLWAQGVEEAKLAWQLRWKDIDLLLSDVVMPDGFGPELARELREKKPELRVLYISGYDDGTLGQPLAAEESGFVLIRKPFSIERLVDNVEKALTTDPTPPTPQASVGGSSRRSSAKEGPR